MPLTFVPPAAASVGDRVNALWGDGADWQPKYHRSPNRPRVASGKQFLKKSIVCTLMRRSRKCYCPRYLHFHSSCSCSVLGTTRAAIMTIRKYMPSSGEPQWHCPLLLPQNPNLGCQEGLDPNQRKEAERGSNKQETGDKKHFVASNVLQISSHELMAQLRVDQPNPRRKRHFTNHLRQQLHDVRLGRVSIHLRSCHEPPTLLLSFCPHRSLSPMLWGKSSQAIMVTELPVPTMPESGQ